MTDKKHPAETFCQNTLFRNPHALEHAQFFYGEKAKGKISWPDWCLFPMAATYAILTQGAGINKATSKLVTGPGILELSNLTAALTWQKSKMIYRFDKTLAEELFNQPLDGNIPCDVLFRLLYPCVFIELDGKVGGEPYIGFFAWMEADMNSNIPELRLLFLMKTGDSISFPVILSGGTLDESYEALIKSGMLRAAQNRGVSIPKSEFSGPDLSLDNIAGAINLVLYLCADEADIPDDTQLRKRRSYDRNKNPKRVVTWDVGMRIGAALRKASVGRPTTTKALADHDSHNHHNSPRPHMRRAHWHAFWTGPIKGPRKLVVKWLPPIQVNMVPETTLPVVLSPVK